MSDEENQQNDDDLLSGSSAQGPVLWFALLAFPVILGLIFSFHSATRLDDTAVQEVQAEARQQRAESRNMVQGRFADLVGRRSASRSSADQDIFCPVDAFTDQVFTRKIEETIKASGRPYRVIEQFKMYTNDYIPERINVRLFRDGRIETVWCG